MLRTSNDNYQFKLPCTIINKQRKEQKTYYITYKMCPMCKT